MTQIGTIKIKTQNHGKVSVPVYDTADAGSNVYNMVRVYMNQGVGFIPFVDTEDASYPFLCMQTQNHGVVAAHSEASLVPDKISYNFESGDNSEWDDINNLSIVADRVYDGSYAGYCGSSQSNTYQARDVPNGFSGGVKPSKFEYFWNETANSYGGGIRLINSNGNVEAGFATDNPQWEIDDGGGIETVYSGDGYDRWIRYTITFDWSKGTFDIEFEDLQSGYVFTDYNRQLMRGLNIEAIQVEDFSFNTWREGSSIDMWFDNISFKL